MLAVFSSCDLVIDTPHVGRRRTVAAVEVSRADPTTSLPTGGVPPPVPHSVGCPTRTGDPATAGVPGWGRRVGRSFARTCGGRPAGGRVPGLCRPPELPSTSGGRPGDSGLRLPCRQPGPRCTWPASWGCPSVPRSSTPEVPPPRRSGPGPFQPGGSGR